MDNAQDIELLSAYLDGELSDTEQSVLVARLALEPALQQELAELQATIELIKKLPFLTAPRSYTLDPQIYGKKPIPKVLRPRFQTWMALPIAAAILSVLVGVSVFFSDSSNPTNTRSEADGVAMQSAITEATQVKASPTLLPQTTQEVAFASTIFPTPTELDDQIVRQSATAPPTVNAMTGASAPQPPAFQPQSAANEAPPVEQSDGFNPDALTASSAAESAPAGMSIPSPADASGMVGGESNSPEVAQAAVMADTDSSEESESEDQFEASAATNLPLAERQVTLLDWLRRFIQRVLISLR